ncbi:DUF6785 family protein [Desulforhopalus singaporensis]|uniref:Uncharacterized protein n=1 Tax=Desulforhopalus singaporensis TaxID=91360 RepID=A0A1H0M6M3_9BACT|nr:DUF6785 family protein [Desulforhopalus singaporensis]SDO76044.1 hypothetical protein SAMN05660330_01002 [Desulforhopalus singaporensis]
MEDTLQSRKPAIVRTRAVVLGLLLAVVICLLTPYNNIFLRATPLGGGHFPLAPFFIFLLMATGVALIAAIFKSKLLLTGPELLVIWIQMVAGSGVAYTGFARTFLINLTAPYHFATQGNKWQEVLHPLIPPALTPSNPEAIMLLYNGLPDGRRREWLEIVTAIPWSAWITPLVFWTFFTLLCYLIMLFLINIISRQWIHNERMNLPLLKVPEAISRAVNDNQAGLFFSNRFLLAGIAVPVFLHLVNGLNLYFPSIPAIPTLFLAGPYFPKQGLLAGFYKLKIYIYPAFIGFAFLTSRQISFSFWFFFLSAGLLYGILGLLGYTIPAAELGITFGPTLARPEEMQMIGAYGVFFLFLVWLARLHLLDVCLQSFFVKKSPPVRSEWFDVRISFWGAIGGMGLLVCWYIYLGMAPVTATLLVGAFFMIMIVATRVICQGGLAYFTLTAAPADGMIALFGTKLFTGASGLLAGMSQKVLFVDLRESLLPTLLHSRHLHRGKRPALLLFGGLALTISASMAASILAMMALCYKYGIRELQLDWATRTTTTVYENIYRLIATQSVTGEWVLIFALIGALVMLVLVVCYHRLHWWPIHPIGYLTAYSSAMRILWVSFFIGWACNALCMRYGGIAMFRKLQLFFIGLIIGDFLMGGCWAMVGLFSSESYQVLPD